MNNISGKILLKETNVGVPDLLVSIFDLDPGTRPEEVIASIGNPNAPIATNGQGLPVDCLGSVLTLADGSFALTYEDEEFRIRNQEKRPDLFLLVLAPEEAGKDLKSRILFMSTQIRQNAGRIEQFLIWLTKEQLEQAGIPTPSTENQSQDEPDDVIAQIKKVEEVRLKLGDGLGTINSMRISSIQQHKSDFEQKIKPQLAQDLSGVSPKLAGSDTFISAGQSVAQKNLQLMSNRIQNVINNGNNPTARVPMMGRIRLSEAQKQTLQTYKDPSGDFANVPEDILEPILFASNEGNQLSSSLLRQSPINRLCLEEAGVAKCLDDADNSSSNDGSDGNSTNDEGNSGNVETGDIPGNGVELSLENDIPRYIARLMDQLNSPEEPVVFGELTAGKRADQNDIQRRIEALSFRRGPADVPAFYDFHNLQIAFDHVWQEAIDEGILDLAENIHHEIVELGGSPPPATSLRDFVAYTKIFIKAVSNDPPPADVVQIFNITRAEWNVLDKTHKLELHRLAAKFLLLTDDSKKVLNTNKAPHYYTPVSAPGVGTDEFRRSAFLTWRQWGERIIRYAKSELEARKEAEVEKEISDLQNYSKLHRILNELEQRITEAYPFTIFAANHQERSVNFGLLITYRQEWEPIAYQAGKLVKTITLTPNEERKFSKKTVVKRSQARKEAENHTFSRKEDASITSRAEAEIVRNAQTNTNFKLTTEGNINLGVEGTKLTSAFGEDAGKTSNEVKKEFHEAVLKSSQTYQDEFKVDLSFEETFEQEFVESGKIYNLNQELCVTYLFYQLQRRYKVSEHMHQLLPVVLVAQEVPAPHEIDDDWLISYDWILRRFLLDDTFRPALDYLSTDVVGDEYALKEMRKNVEMQRRLTEQLKEEVVAYRELTGQRYAALESAIERSAQAATKQDDGSLFGVAGKLFDGPATHLVEKGLEFLTGEGENPDAARIRERAARDAYEKAMQEERDLMARLNREITALNAMTEAYTKTLSEHLNRRTQISRLRVHVKQNILYYMQAIWSMEPPDQRFFRLHKVDVPVFEKTGKSLYTIQGTPTYNLFIDPSQPKVNVHEYTVNTQIDPTLKTTSLVEVADLDNLLGFKGNYMIFPLKKPNALTNFMMAPYIEQEWKLYDPDVFGNMTLDEFSDYVCCLKDKMPATDFDAVKPELKKLLEQLLTSPLRNNEEIVVPTDSLFIEALPGVHPILEDFKLIHRAIDVKSAQEDARRKELENVRFAARILAGELDDPEIEKKIIIEGSNQDLIISPGDA